MNVFIIIITVVIILMIIMIIIIVFSASGRSAGCLEWKEIRFEATWGFYVFLNPRGQSNLICLNTILMLATLRIRAVHCAL